MNTKKLRLLIIPAIIVLIIIVANVLNSNVDGVTGEKWTEKSYAYIDNVNSFIENMDNYITLYLSGITTADSFSSDYNLLKKQWKLLNADYNKFVEENPILPDSDTVPSQMNYDAAQKLYDEIDKLFIELDNIEITNTKHISYAYLAHQQAIVDSYTTYLITYNVVTGVYSD